MVSGVTLTLYDCFLMFGGEVRWSVAQTPPPSNISVEDSICLERSQDMEFVFIQSV